MQIRIVNKIRYNDPEKSMKQTSLTVKKPQGETFPKSNSLQ